MDERIEQPTVEEIFLDFKGRRSGIIKALDTDLDSFYQRCDPEGKNLCLYGYPNGQWEVKIPTKNMPPEIPEPVMALTLPERLDKTERKRLFDMINDLPTIYEVLFATELKPLGPWTSLVNPESNSKGFRHRIWGACEENYETGEFWIRCNKCEKWFHGVCVNILSARAEKMKNFYCLPCQKRSL